MRGVLFAMRGLGRVVVITLINFLIVYVIIAIVLSSIYSTFAYRQIKGLVDEMVRAYERQIKEVVKDPDVARKAVEKYNETLYEQYGLLMPMHERVLLYTYNLIRFNLTFPLGYDVQYPVPGDDALEVAFNAMIRTAILFTTASVILLIINIFLGLQAAKRAGGLFDRGLALTALVTSSLPMWWTAMIMILVFSFILKIFPSRSIAVLTEVEGLDELNLPPHEYFIRYIGSWIYHMALPILTVIIVSFGIGAYVIRSIVLTTSREDFVVVARAKGLPERSVLYKHILRAASPPIVTMIVFSLIGSFLGGAIISERVFYWPGMGFVYWTAITYGDAGVLLTLSWISVVLYLGAYFILDFVYMLLDPRIRVGRGVE